MAPRQRRLIFLVAAAGLVALYLWGLAGLPGFGRYPGPYGAVINKVAVAQTHATGVVSAVNFEYRGFDTLGEEFILFVAAIGVSTVLRHLRGEQEHPEAGPRLGGADAAAAAVRLVTLVFAPVVIVVGWYLASHAQTSPSGGFQGGVVLATAFVLMYLGGGYLAFRQASPPVDIADATEAAGAGAFAAIGVAAVGRGLPFLANFLPLGVKPGAVSSSGTIALISFFVAVEVAAAFVVIVAEFVRQTLLTGQASQ